MRFFTHSLVTAVVLGCVTEAFASLAEPQSLATLAGKSAGIVRAEVVWTHAVQDPATDRIYTEVSVQVDDVVAGEAFGSDFTFVVPGGRIGDLVRMAVGAPWFESGQDYYLLLRRGADGQPTLTNLLQAAFPVQVEAGRARRTLINDMPARGIREAPLQESWTDDEFADVLREAWQISHEPAPTATGR